MELDYDLSVCLDCNDIEIKPDHISAVLAVWEGENDGDDWRWVVSLHDGRFAFIQGGCDYTGWDCQSWATCEFAETPEAAAQFSSGEGLPAGTLMEPQGMGHMISMLTGSYMDNAGAVLASLMTQLEAGKSETWREQKDRELGVDSTAPFDGTIKP